MGQVCLAAVTVDFGESADAAVGEPGQEPNQLDEPRIGRAEVYRRAIGAGQSRHRLMPRREHGKDQFLADQPPPWISDRGEVETPAVTRHLHRQADNLGKIPSIVLEQRATDFLRQPKPGLAADIAAREGRTVWIGSGERGAHRVDSSGRSGNSSSQSAT